MKTDFWLERWHKQEIGFHQTQYNANLIQYWDKLALNKGSAVFVPLCGKSDDMLFLAEQGHQVIGVELSEIAVTEFFVDNDLSPSKQQQDGLTIYQAGPFTLYCGDLFKLNQQHLKACQAVYDRASVIALPTPMRESYTQHLAKVLPPLCKTLLICLEYSEGALTGPPFSVDKAEVERLFSKHWGIEELGHCEEDIRGKAAIERSYCLIKGR